MENFIVAYHNAYSKEYCNQVIDWFEQATAHGLGMTRKELEKTPKHAKDDVSVFPFEPNVIRIQPFCTLSFEFLEPFFTKYYNDYVSRFSILENFHAQTIYSLKVQKTVPGGGYHVWHSESENKFSANIVVAFTLYLNDIAEGGETEYLYQGLRIKPEQGTLVLWPAGFTHPHRGNPPLKETKYIITGWVEFQQEWIISNECMGVDFPLFTATLGTVYLGTGE